MLVKHLTQCLLVAVVAIGISLPSQAAMVGTAQLQSSEFAADSAGINAKRDWITQQLVADNAVAKLRVAALTDAQLLEIHQRIDKEPAGGNSTLIIIFLILVITELLGVTDIVPNWPAN
jgi:hypothetical protein